MNILPLTAAQKRIWVEWKLNPNSPAYNNPLAYQIDGEINYHFLTQALQSVVDEQPALRTYFIEQAGIPKQILKEAVEVKLAFHDFSEKNTDDIASAIDANVKNGFILSELPLFRFSLIKIGKDAHILIFNIHHIVVDGHSANLLIQKVSNFYNDANHQSLKYDDIYHQFLLKEASIPQEKSKFWVDQLQDANFMADLYTKNVDYYLPNDSGIRTHFSISKETTLKVKQIAKKNKTTDFIVLMSAFYIVLAKYANQYDITIGYAVDTRPHDCKDLFGFFVNNIPLRLIFSPDDTIESCIAKLTSLRKKIKANQDIDYADIVKLLRKKDASIPNHLYNLSFIRANFALEGLVLNNANIKNKPVYTGSVKDDLCLLYDEADNFEFEIEYKSGQYEAEYISAIQSSYVACLNAMLENLDKKVSDINLFKIDQSNVISSLPNYPKNNDTLIQKLAESATLYPEKMAIKTNKLVVNYADLYQKVKELTRYFVENKLIHEKPVVVYVDRTPLLIATFLSLQWLGITYIPLDINTPADRILHIMEESGSQAIIVDKNSPIDGYHSIAISGNIISNRQLPDPVNHNYVCYIIYTSGSTGKPKGVAVERDALNNFLQGMSKQFLLPSQSCLLAITTVAFDISILELFLPIWCNQSIYLANQKQYKDPFEIKKILDSEQISLLQATPAMWRMLIDVGLGRKSNLTALCGGEALSQALADELLGCVDGLWNMYGPTEATIWCSMKKIQSGERVTIGTAIDGLMLFVMDEKLNYLPPFVKGDLYIAGIGLANGYFNQPELTKSAFIYHPTLNLRLYKTGDIASQVDNNEFIVYGRKDNQIKLNGYRIELGEIESNLQKIEGISESAVIVNQQQLVAFISATKALSSADIKRYLYNYLPEYMIPSRYIFIDKMPITNSGKIDRKFLLGLDAHSVEQLEPAKNELEAKVLNIWQKVLQCEMGVTDNFYAVGGHSLLATQIISLLQAEYSIDLSMSDFFKYQTIRECASFIAHYQASTDIINKTEKEYYPLTETQKRLFFLALLSDEGKFNMAASIKLQGKLDLSKFHQAVLKLANEHTILSTQFLMVNDEPVQKIICPLSIEIETKKGEENSEFLTRWAKKPFNLLNQHLWRYSIIEESENNFVINICLHHLLCDGYSIPILLESLWKYYETENMEVTSNNKEISYLDYALWLNNQPNNISQFDYWKNQLAGYKEFGLPLDYPRANQQLHQGEQLSCRVEPSNFSAIKSYCQSQSISFSSYAIATFAILLNRVTGLDDFCIGLPISNREKANLSGIVGCFMEVMPLRISIDPSLSFNDWVKSVHSYVQECLTIKPTKFNNLLTALSIPRQINKAPLFNVILNVQKNPFNRTYSSQFKMDINSIHTGTSKYDLSVDLYLSENEVNIVSEYSTDLFKQTTIQAWLDIYRGILNEFSISNKTSLIIVDEKRSKSVLVENCVVTDKLPMTKLQKIIADIWSDNLNMHNQAIYINDNYFSLGGHSLMAAKIIKKLSDILMIDIPLESIFFHPEIEQFSLFIEKLLSEKIVREPTKKYEINDDYIPLTPNQRQLVLMHAQDPSDQYHLGVKIQLSSAAKIDKLQEKIIQIINSQHIYKWNLDKLNGTGFINKNMNINIENYISENINDTIKIANKFIRNPYDIYHDPLVRFSFIKQNESKYLVIGMHHLIGDEWSLELLASFILADDKNNNQSKFFNGLSWQEYVNGKETSQIAVDYWKGYLQDKKMSHMLPTKRIMTDNKLCAYYHGSLPSDILNHCEKISAELGVSLYIVIFALHLIFLKLYLGDSNILIGSSNDRRSSVNLQNTHGYLVNLIPIISDLDNNSTLYELINKINNDRRDHFEHAAVDFAELVEKNIVDKPGIVINFQHNFSLENNELALDWQAIHSTQAKFPLVFNLRMNKNKGLDFTIEYNSNYYDESFISDCSDTLVHLFKSLNQNKDKSINQWSMEYRNITLIDQSYTPPSLNNNFIYCLNKVGEKFHHRPAICYNGKTTSYADLWQKVRHLSCVMQEKYKLNMQGKVVGVSLPSSDSYIVSILAILSLGATFLPIDCHYPEERKKFIVENANMVFMLSENSDSDIKCWSFADLMAENITQQKIELNAGAENGYIIYTSGTTGVPKAVSIKQNQLYQFIHGLKNKLAFNETEKVLQFASISFDASIWEIFISLYSGAAICIPNDLERNAGSALENYINTNQVTHMILTPSVLNTLNVKNLPSLRSVASGGESCTAELISQWSSQLDFYNAYGPTEATICTNLFLTQSHSKASIIGGAIGSAELAIVSDSNQILPPGAIGELLIGGTIITDGYINSLEANQLKFTNLSGQRYYRSGDYARILNGSVCEYLGRKDSQVKLRGLRVELGEIESIIKCHMAIQQVVCHIHNDELSAYIISDQHVQASVLLAQLRQKLPAFMVPKHLVFIDKVPLSTNGKIAYSQLPIPTMQLDAEIQQPTNEIEKTLHAIWQQHLDITDISINQDFFSLGGNSLQAMQISSDIYQQLNIEVPFQEFYIHSNIAQQAELILKLQKTNDEILLNAIGELSDEELLALF